MKVLRFGILLLFASLFVFVLSCKKNNEDDDGGNGGDDQKEVLEFFSTYYEIGAQAVPKYISRFTYEDGELTIAQELDKVAGDAYGIMKVMDHRNDYIAFYADKENFADKKYHFVYYNRQDKNTVTLPEIAAPEGFETVTVKMCPRITDNGKIYYMQKFTNTSIDEYITGNIVEYDINSATANPLPSVKDFILSQEELDDDPTDATIDPDTQIEVSKDGKYIYMNSIAFHINGVVFEQDKEFLIRYNTQTGEYEKIDAATDIILAGMSQDDKHIYYRQNVSWKKANIDDAGNFSLVLLDNSGFDYGSFPVQRQARYGTKIVYIKNHKLFLKDLEAETQELLVDEPAIKNAQFDAGGENIFFVKDKGDTRFTLRLNKPDDEIKTDTLFSFDYHYKMDLLFLNGK